MKEYKEQFIEFMVECDVLTFGDFVTKSGRSTPYFINTGKYSTGDELARLGEFYAEAIEDQEIEFDLLFGPAYKGIPLAVTTSISLSKRDNEVGYLFNRKEIKDHGEGGILVGDIPVDGSKILIIEDVTTAGTSIKETVPVLRATADIKLAGLVVSVDRCERGESDLSGLEQVSSDYDMPTFAIVTVTEIMEYLHNRPVDGRVVLGDEELARMKEYLSEYGVIGETA